ncbi:hypothetical protein [Polaribacter ponticola]|uniref:Lipopolysaccharide biosynthesis protein n=1 Tax=Polaribacter ponticola TaxID=2978475 RepID=A0ABT5SAL0_9FLAO|nr:hypothetical protein [Polaribacter sp. MSW5]MDD7915128.1 hypothetical protein [Polaribacter sp. MSW5]
MSTNQKNNEEEVDLGSLFVIIGKGFSNFFHFIGSIFKGLFHFIISILLFLKENFLKIVGTGIIGLIAGIFLEINSSSKYGSDLLVEPNFKSARQLYDNVNYYNDLVKQKDIIALQTIFSLDEESAASLKKFTIEPLVIDSDKINAYNELILSIDTLAIKSYEYDVFKTSFTEYDYKVHKITVIAEKNNVFDKLDDVIISSVVNNTYFKRIKELTNENLNRTDSLYRQNLIQIDSLRRVYMKVMLEEAKKSNTGTSIDLGDKKKGTNEMALFETSRRLNYDLKSLAAEKSTNFKIINVISSFQSVGYEIKGITKNKAFLLGIVGSVLMIVFLLLMKLNKFLENYKK